MILALLVPLALVAACDKVPLLAPTGTTITLIPTSTSVPNNSQTTIVATVIEHGTASGSSGTSTSTTSTGGTPVQNGTLITFTTTLGHIEPAEARTNNGQVAVTLFTDNNSGTPTITAYSGGASATNSTIKIGAATVKTVSVTAQPATLGSSGGTTTLTALVVNDQGSPVSGVPVTFTTDNGTMSPATATTDSNGNATTTLTTTKTAKVSATAGSVTSASALTVTVSATALSGFKADTANPVTGQAVSFTVTPNTNANLQNVHVDFGDGHRTDLGPISAPSNPQNVYCAPGSYSATATASDSAGGSGTLSTNVFVGALPVTITTGGTATSGSPITFTAGFGSAAPLIDHIVWAFSDGTPDQSSSSPTTVHTFTTKGLKTVRVDVFAVGCGKVATNAISIDVQ